MLEIFARQDFRRYAPHVIVPFLNRLKSFNINNTIMFIPNLELEFKQSATYHSVVSVKTEDKLIKSLLNGGYELGSVLAISLRKLYPNITVVHEDMGNGHYNIYFESPEKEIKREDVEKAVEEQISNMKKTFETTH